MAKRAYIGIDGQARKVRHGYLGVDGTARKIKKAYIGVGGVARPCWSGGTVVYYGGVSALSQARRTIAAGTIGSKALFAGGSAGQAASAATYATVDVYDAALTKSAATGLSTPRGQFANTGRLGDDRLFIAGGYSKGAVLNTVDIYDADLTRSTATLSTGKKNVNGMDVGSYCLLAGGGNASDEEQVSADAFNADLTRTAASALFYGGAQRGCNVAGRYAVYGHQQGSTAYDADLTRTAAAALSAFQHGVSCGLSFGAYGFFSGHYVTNSEVFDRTLTKTALAPKSSAASGAATVLGDFVLIGGGYQLTGGYSAHMDCYDDSFTRTALDPLGAAIGNSRAAAAGDFALFAAGESAAGTTIGNVYAYKRI